MKTHHKLLSNIDLAYYCKLYGIPLNNILFKDLFSQEPLKPGCYIINLQSSTTEGGGTHWTGLVVSAHFAVYFDPFGLPIPTPLMIALQKHRIKNPHFKIIYSIDQIQQLDSIFCGWFVLYFLYFFTVQYIRRAQISNI